MILKLLVTINFCKAIPAKLVKIAQLTVNRDIKELGIDTGTNVAQTMVKHTQIPLQPKEYLFWQIFVVVLALVVVLIL